MSDLFSIKVIAKLKQEIVISASSVGIADRI